MFATLNDIVVDMLKRLEAKKGTAYHIEVEKEFSLVGLADIKLKRRGCKDREFDALEKVEKIIAGRFNNLEPTVGTSVGYGSSIGIDGDTCTLEVHIDYPDPDNPRIAVMPTL